MPQNSTFTCSCRVLVAFLSSFSVRGMAVPSKSFRWTPPARLRNVGARSVWAVTISEVFPSGTPGPRIISGMFMSSSNPHSLPGWRRCWLMW